MPSPPPLAMAVLTVLREQQLATNDLIAALRQKGWISVTPEDVAEVLSDMEFVKRDGIWARRPDLPPELTARQVGIDQGMDPDWIEHLYDAESDDAAPSAPDPSIHEGGSDEWRRTCRAILTGLDHELEAARREATETVALTDGRALDHQRARVAWLYEYSTAGSLRIPDGTRVRIKLGSKWWDAEVMGSQRRSIVLTATVALPRGHTDAELRYDLIFLLERQRERWRQLTRSTDGFNWQAALDVQRSGPTPRDCNSEVPDEDIIAGHLNEAQRQAVRQAKVSGTTWIWGPPGTGKTTTIAALVDEFARAGRRILLVSNTNAAIDTAMARCLNAGGLAAGLRPGAVLRIGQSTDPMLTGADPPVLIERIAATRGDPIAQRIAELVHREQRLSVRIEAIDDRIRVASLEGRQGEKSMLQERRRDLVAERAMYSVEARRMHSLLDSVRESCIAEARVVFATAHQCYLSDLERQRFDVVVVDECSMVATALALLAVGMGQSHFVLAGDFRQLGPIAQAEDPQAVRWLQRSLFETADIDRKVVAGEPLPQLVALREQHRMRAPIAELVSDAFYPENRLITAGTVIDRPSLRGPDMLQNAVTVIDTSGLDAWMRKAGGRRSRYNPAHAMLAAAVVEQLPNDEDIALISPYSAQARLLEAFGTGERVVAATVHRFQGGERSTVIFDTTEGQGGGIGIGRWFKSEDPSKDGARLINVALSRAKDRLIILADLHRIRADNTGSPVGRLFHALRRPDTAGLRRLNWRDVLKHSAGGVLIGDGTELHSILVEAIAEASERTVVWTACLPSGDNHRELLTAARRSRGRGAALSVWTSPPSDAAAWSRAEELARTGTTVRLVEQARETFAVVDDEVFIGTGSLFGARRESSWLLRRDANLAAALVGNAWRKPLPGASGQRCPTDVDDRGAFVGGSETTVRIEGYMPSRGWTAWPKRIVRPEATQMSTVTDSRRDVVRRSESKSWTRSRVPTGRPCPSCGIVPNHLARCAC